MKKSAGYNLVKLIMAFAMFWLFIGDLIILHQSRIFGHDFFGQHHQPFSKPGKSDDGKTFQKYHKSGDKNDDGKVFAQIPFCTNHLITPVEIGYVVYSTSDEADIARYFLSGIGLRAPPTIL